MLREQASLSRAGVRPADEVLFGTVAAGIRTLSRVSMADTRDLLIGAVSGDGLPAQKLSGERRR